MSMPTLQQHSILWGDLQLHGPDQPDVDYDMKAIGVGTNFGNPVPIVEAVRSLAIDGALAAITGWDNREFPIRLRVAANNGETHAQVEAALVAQCLLDRPPPLIWTPPLGSSAPVVFDVVVAELDRDTDDGWDQDEKRQGFRYWKLTLTCLPSVHPIDSSTIEAIAPPSSPGSPSVTDVLDECTSATVSNWSLDTDMASHTGPTAGTTGTLQTYIQVTGGTLVSGTQHLHAIRAGSLTMPAGQQYLAIDVKAFEQVTGGTVNLPGNLQVRLDGVTYPIALVGTGLGQAQSTRLYVSAPGVTFTELRVLKDYDDSIGSHIGRPVIINSAVLQVFRVAATNVLGDTTTSTTRQQARSATVYGSMPTRATIRLYDATPGNLGANTLIYTSNNLDFTPPLRRWLVSSASVSTDTSMVSGGYHDLSVPTVFNIPASMLEDAAYALMARIKVTTAGTLSWQARLVDSSGAATLGSGRILSGSISLPVTTGMTVSGFQVFDLADRLQLPPIEVETDDYNVEITLTGTANMTLDEGFLFDLDNGALTWVQDQDGLQWIEVRSPELGAARPSVFGGIGPVGTMSQCIDYKCLSFGAHRFIPGPLQVFTMTTTSLVAQCELEYFPRFHSHVQAVVLDEATD